MNTERQMPQLFEICALRRSGCHAVLNWLFNQSKKPVLFFNNAIPFQDPLRNLRAYGELQNTIDLEPYYHGRHPKEDIKSFRADVVAILYEDLKLSRIDGRNSIVDSDWINPESVTKVLILRDFYNWLASRLLLAEQKKMAIDTEMLIYMWKSYAHQLLYDHLGQPFVCVNFNRWFSSETYRNELARVLGLELRNDDTKFVPSFGGGSSFDRVSYGKKGRTDFKISDRWQYLFSIIIRLYSEKIVRG
jgi:hypothetical protein